MSFGVFMECNEHQVIANDENIFIRCQLAKPAIKNKVQYNACAMQCNTIQYNTIQCNAMQCNAMQCNTIQCNAMQ